MRTDFLLDDDFDLMEDPDTKDFIEGASDDQHVQLLVLTNKGEWKQNPQSGFGITNRLKSKSDVVGFIRDLKVELKADGYGNAVITMGNDYSDLKIEIPV